MGIAALCARHRTPSHASLDSPINVTGHKVISGAQLYALALPLAHALELTEVDADLEGDSSFPSWDRTEFERIASQTHASAQGLPFSINSYRRR